MIDIDELSKQLNIFFIVCFVSMIISLISTILISINLRYTSKLIKHGTSSIKLN